MATKRMFSNIVIDSDKFLDLSPMQQLLYFHCGMKTDDDGFVSGARRIARIIGATDDDYAALVNNGFLIDFPESKVCCVVHHRQNNNVQNDRYHETDYKRERSQLTMTENKEWQLVSIPEPECIHDGSDENTEHNVSYPNVSYPNETNVNIEEGSGEGGNTLFVDPIALKGMTDKAGISRQIVENAIDSIGALKTYQAFKEWEKNDKPDTNKFSKYVLERVS